MANDIVPQNRDSNQDSDASIAAMLDELLLQDNLRIQLTIDGWELLEIENSERGWPSEKTIDTYETIAAAYRAAIDCVIELSIEGWDKGGQS